MLIFLYIKTLNNLLNPIRIYDDLNNTEINTFGNIVIFFTGEVSKYLMRYKKNFFSEKKIIYNPYDIKYFEIPEYILTLKEKNIIENHKKNI